MQIYNCMYFNLETSESLISSIHTGISGSISSQANYHIVFAKNSVMDMEKEIVYLDLWEYQPNTGVGSHAMCGGIMVRSGSPTSWRGFKLGRVLEHERSSITNSYSVLFSLLAFYSPTNLRSSDYFN